MTKIATGYVALKAEVDDLRRDLAKANTVTTEATAKMQGQAVKTGKSFKAMWLAYAAGAAIVAAGAMKAIKAASDLQETTSKFNVVFKGQQKLAESWAKTLVDSFAMSTREAKANLSSIQDLLVPMGMASDAAGRMSFEVVKLSADLASFNNLPTEQVMLDIQSALVGNFETMKKYGVVLNATVVQQKAMEMGLAKTKAELNAGMKAQAAYALMVEGSAAALGDMARTSDSFANVAKQAQAAWEDFMAALGDLILPVATKVLSGITSMIKGLNELIDDVKAAKGFADETDKWAIQAATREGDVLADALGPGAPVGGGGAATGGAGGESQQMIDMKAVMKEAKALREEDTVDLFSTLDAQEQYKTEMQAKDIARIAGEQAALQTFNEWKAEQKEIELRAQEDAYAAKTKLTEDHLAAILAIHERFEARKRQLALQTASATLSTAATLFNTLYQLTGSKHKALFALVKAFEVARAVVNAFAASGQALANPPGPPWTIPLSQAVLAMGLANAASIAALAIGSGSGGGASGGALSGGDGGSYGGQIPAGLPDSEAEGQQGQINIYIEGDMLADELYLEMLAEKISEAVEGNEVRLIASETRAT